MKSRKVYTRNNILHCCYKGCYYAPEDGEPTEITDADRVLIYGGDKGCDTIDIRGEAACGAVSEHEETWVKTDVDGADPRLKIKVPVELLAPRNPPPPRTPEEVAEDEEADLLAEEARVKEKAAQAQDQPKAQKVANILEL